MSREKVGGAAGINFDWSFMHVWCIPKGAVLKLLISFSGFWKRK